MASVFSKIMQNELPAYFIWEEASVAAFLDTNPHSRGHTLVVPRREVDRWTDLADDEGERLFWVAKQIAKAQIGEFACDRAGLVIAGYHVPHVHVHVFPTNGMDDFDFRELGHSATAEDLELVAGRLRGALSRRGLGTFVVRRGDT